MSTLSSSKIANLCNTQSCCTRKKGVEFCRKSVCVIRCSLVTLCDVMQRHLKVAGGGLVVVESIFSGQLNNEGFE